MKNKVKEKCICICHNYGDRSDTYCIHCKSKKWIKNFKSPNPSKDKVIRHGNTTHYKSQSCYVCEGRKPKYIEQVTHKPKNKPVKVEWEEEITILGLMRLNNEKYRLYNVKELINFVRSLLSKQGERIMNKTKYLLETFVWDMGLSISENRRRLNKFVMERETNIDKLVKSIKKYEM